MRLDFPLRFQPLFRDYLWGGSRLRQCLGKLTGPGTWAESWEVVDHPHGQSTVLDGPLAGIGLHELMLRFGKDILGEKAWNRINRSEIPAQLRGRFPLLFKFLDASQDLSVQVHPSDEVAKMQSPPDLGKTEAWYVIQSLPGSRIYAGLKQGVGKKEFLQALNQNDVASTLHSFQAAAGQCVLIPAGTIHAIGSGVLIAEVQQASDTTFRIYDWDRTGADGATRPLHLEQALSVIDFDRGPIQPVVCNNQSAQELTRCDYFVLSRMQISLPSRIGRDNRFRLISVLAGDLELGDHLMRPGDTALLPAAMSEIELTPATKQSSYLEIQLP